MHAVGEEGVSDRRGLTSSTYIQYITTSLNSLGRFFGIIVLHLHDMQITQTGKVCSQQTSNECSADPLRLSLKPY